MAETSAATRPKVLIIGPLPPPAFGVAKATKLMIESDILAERLRIIHLDTSDTRGVANIGRLDPRNAFLALKHLTQLFWVGARRRPNITLLTASQGKFGLLRDVLLVMMSRAFGSKIVTYLRGSRYAQVGDLEGPLAARALRYIFESSARVIVLGTSLVGMAHSVYPDARVAVIPNGCLPAVRDSLVGIRDENHPTLLYIGRLGSAKGIETAVRATRRVADAIPKLEFTCCGEWESPEYEAVVRKLVHDLDLDDPVRFPGPTTGPDKEAYLAAAWVLVVASSSEGHPWVILEAMSAGIPVVATATGAIPETVEDGVTGFVVPIGDSDALAARVISVLANDGLWKRMSKESVRRYGELFTVERSHSLLADELCRVAAED
jgi:glycosyltransferase involved in cell wall biosynthesis